MKLLLDENLSEKLVPRLVGDFPGTTHVRLVGLRGQADGRIWDYARQHGFVILSKDTDFRDRSYVDGPPPKVVWLRVGNAGTAAIAAVLARRRERLMRFEEDEETALAVVGLEQA